MDMSDTIAPTSDQLDAVDLLAGPKTFTITKVAKNNGDQPVDIHLAEFPRVWRPGKSMRRVLVACWGADATQYVGRRVRLFCDPTVKFGGAEVGGTRIEALSHLDKARTVPLLVTRGKSAPFRVVPLVEDAPPASKPQPLADRIAQAIAAFGAGGITEEQLVGRVGRPSADWTADDVATLLALFESLRNKQITKDEAFPPAETLPVEEPPGADPDEFDPTERGFDGAGAQ